MDRRVMLGLVLLGAMVGCSSTTGYGGSGGSGNMVATPGANQVFLQNIAFNPATRTVSKGTTVQWVNQDGIVHTVTWDGGPGPSFDSGNLSGGSSFSVTLDSAGTYTYHCKIHGAPGSGMHGSVVVQ